MEINLNDYVFIDIEKLTNPDENGQYHLFKNYYWVVSEGTTAWYKKSLIDKYGIELAEKYRKYVPLCNEDERIIKHFPLVINGLSEYRKIHKVWVPIYFDGKMDYDIKSLLKIE